jgi:hypothetical protein
MYAQLISIETRPGQTDNCASIASNALQQAKEQPGFSHGEVLTNAANNHVEMIALWRSKSDADSNLAGNTNYLQSLRDIGSVEVRHTSEDFEVRSQT